MLADVNIKNAVRIYRDAGKQCLYGVARYFRPLGQCPETHGVGTFGQLFHRFGERNIIPCDTFVDRIGRNTLVEFNPYSSCRIVNPFNDRVDINLIDFLYDFITQRILSHRADRITCRTQAGSVVRKVYGCAPYFLSCGKHVPQELSYTDNNGFINHIFCLSSYSQTKIQLTDAIFTLQKYKKVSKQRLVFHLSSMVSLLH